MAGRRRSAPVSVLRSRLNERLSANQKPKKTSDERRENAETTEEKKRFFFMSFSLGFMRNMNSYFYLKMAIALLVVLMLGIINQTGWTWTGRMIEGVRHVVNWDMDLQYVKDRVVPVFNNMDADDIWQKVLFFSREKEHALPVNGELQSGFGLRENPQSGADEMHYGIDVVSEKGAPVRSVLSGRVVALDEGENGSVITIEHDKNWTGVYEGVEEIRVAVGDEVNEAQILGVLGDGRNGDLPGLYFELRYNGRPQDPLLILGDFYQNN